MAPSLAAAAAASMAKAADCAHQTFALQTAAIKAADLAVPMAVDAAAGKAVVQVVAAAVVHLLHVSHLCLQSLGEGLCCFCSHQQRQHLALPALLLHPNESQPKVAAVCYFQP